MVDLGYLKGLLELLKQSGVTQIKVAGLELSLEPIKAEVRLGEALAPPSHEEPTNPLPNPEAIAADDSMNFDKILNWSASPDPSEPMPLTGEEPL